MPISNSYPSGIPIEDPDLFVGTKAANNRTVNYTAQGIANYLNTNSKVSIGGQMSFQFTITPNIPKTIAFDGGLGDNTAFSAITKLIVSAIDVSTANITIFLNYLNNSQVLLSEQNQPNFFGHYKITGYTQIGISAFYELDLEFIGGNGTIVDKQYYDLISFVLSTEAPATVWGDITGDIEDQTDLVNYVSSQITTPTLQEVTDEGNTTTKGIKMIVPGSGTPENSYLNVLLGSQLLPGLSLGHGQLTGDRKGFISLRDIENYEITTIDNNKISIATDTSSYNYLFNKTKDSGTYTLATLEDIPPLSTVYQNEIHVSKDGSDVTGDGTLLNPFASITQGLTLVAGARKTIVLHPGTYTESPNITVQYTVLTSLQSIGGNTLISGTVTTSTGCTISGLKMTALTINGVTGRGNINILNCDISGTFTKNGTADYTLIRFCDIGAVNIVSSAGVLAVLGGNLSFITVNTVGASILVKNAVCISPVVSIGSATFVDCILISTGPTTNALTTSAGTNIVLANSQCVIPTFQNVARVSLSGFYSIFNTVFDKPNSFLIPLSNTGGSTNSIDYFQFINADKFIKQGGTSLEYLMADGSVTTGTGGSSILTTKAQLTYLDRNYTIFDAFYLRVIADSGTIESTSQLLSTLANLRSISYTAQGYTQQLNADKFVKLGGTAEKYLMADGSALSNIATNATTTALSLATLNSTYPTAIIGFRVQCINITAGKLIYEKTSTGWVSYSITVIT